MIIWTLIGIILQWIGNIIKRSDVLFLGYYLAGAGITRSLPIYVWDELVDELFDTGINSDIFEIFTPLTANHVYTTLGKFWVRVENGCFIVKDIYKFYPICENSDIHFSDCTCIYKAYSDLYKAIYIPDNIMSKLLKSPIKNFKIDVSLGKDVNMGIDTIHAFISINDHFWVNKGKQFEVYTEIPITK